MAMKRLRARVEVGKSAPDATGNMKHVACVYIGTWRTRVACMPGRNPRKALAAAFRRAARNLDHARGAFAGYSKQHRRTRRVRRGTKRRG